MDTTSETGADNGQGTGADNQPAGGAVTTVPAVGGTGDSGAGSAVAGVPDQGAKTAANALGIARDPAPDTVPDKYLVKSESGDVDWEATAKKLAPGYNELSKKLGAGDTGAPPAEASGYLDNVKLPDGVTAEQLKADPAMQSFLKGAHARGLSTKTVAENISAYLESQAAVQAQQVQETVASLKGEWGDKFDANAQAVQKAGMYLFGEDFYSAFYFVGDVWNYLYSFTKKFTFTFFVDDSLVNFTGCHVIILRSRRV